MGLGRDPSPPEKLPLVKSLTDPAPLNPKAIKHNKTKAPTNISKTIALQFYGAKIQNISIRWTI
jgi:hypothetical protein